MKSLFELIKSNRALFIYLFFLAILPLFFSSFILFNLVKFHWFFKSLHPLDIGLVFLFFTLTMTFALTPTTFICIMSGYLWGWSSILYVVPSYLIAQTVGFFMAKLINGDRFYNALLELKKVPVYLERLHENELKVIFLCRFSPALPFAIMNVILSILKVNFKTFSWAGLAGMLPRSLFFLWVGTGLSDLSNYDSNNMPLQVFFMIVTFICMGVIFKFVFKKPI